MEQIQSGLYTMAGTAYETYAAHGTDRTTWGSLSEEERQRWVAVVKRLGADKFGRAIQETEVDARGVETRETAVRRIAEWVISTRSHNEKAGAATRRLEDAIMQFLGAAL